MIMVFRIVLVLLHILIIPAKEF